jgi:phosphatidylinositol alpha-1,6-mannosyltransferase
VPAVRVSCLILTNNFPPVLGGAGNVYRSLAAAAGGGIEVLCPREDYRTGRIIENWRDHDRRVNFTIHRIHRVRPRLRQLAGLREKVGYWLFEEFPCRIRLLGKLALLRLKCRFRVLCIADDETVGWIVFLAPWLLGCRTVFYVHGDDLAEGPESVRLDRHRRRQFRRVDGVVVVSAAGAKTLIRRFGVTATKVKVIPNGVDSERFHPMPPPMDLVARYGLSGRRVLVTVARLVSRKGIDRTIEALPRAVEKIPDLHYHIVGDGPERERLHSLAVANSVIDRVSFAGAVDHAEIPGHLALGEVMILPNRRLANGEDEGSPLVFLEANACGKPVISGIAGGVAEFVKHDVNGMCIDGGSVEAIARAIVRLFADAEYYARLSSTALSVARGATWRACAGRFIDFCDHIVNRQKPSPAP